MNSLQRTTFLDNPTVISCPPFCLGNVILLLWTTHCDLLSPILLRRCDSSASSVVIFTDQQYPWFPRPEILPLSSLLASLHHENGNRKKPRCMYVPEFHMIEVRCCDHLTDLGVPINGFFTAHSSYLSVQVNHCPLGLSFGLLEFKLGRSDKWYLLYMHNTKLYK